jgi:hypothetical protein
VVIKLKQVLCVYHAAIRKIPSLTEGAGQNHILFNGGSLALTLISFGIAP